MTGRAIAISASVLVLAISFVLFCLAQRQNGGEYIYPIDDAYIHLAIAKNLAATGSYGLAPNVFTAASSSIGWPLLLGAFYRVSYSVHTGWFCSAIAGALVPLAVYRALEVLTPNGAPVSVHAVVQAMVVVAMPLCPLALSGMEHTAHAVVTLLLATVATSNRKTNTRDIAALFGLGFAATVLRYESFSLCAVCTLVLLQKRAFKEAATLLVGSVVGPLVFALYSKAHGWSHLPNSVILKARRWDADAPRALLVKLQEAPHLVVLLIVLTVVLAFEWQRADARVRAFGIVALWVLVTHMLFGAVGWFYRYEAYVIPLSLVAIALHLTSLRERSRKLAVALALPLVLLLPRGLSSLRALPQASHNIFDEQVHTARFVARHFDGEPVLVNDIGAVAYFSHAPFVDLMGLGDRETAKARGMRIDRPLAAGTLEKLSERAEVAIVYEEWFQAEMPKSWVKVGEFRTTNNRVCAFPQVTIFATHERSVARVRAAFADDQRPRP